MAKYTGAVCRRCRRENEKLFLKGERCYSDKCSLDRRGYAPGQHGQNRKKSSEYGLQLRAKQMTKRYYCILEKQFSGYFKLAERKPGMTGENLLRILESRLDNVVYSAGFASSRVEARQLVLHGHFLLNGKRVNIPSILVKPNDVVELHVNSKKSEKFKYIFENFSSRPVPMWMRVNKEDCKIVVERLCAMEEVQLPVQVHLIVELYSR